MRAKTFISIVAVFALVWFAVSTVRLNRELVTVQFGLLQPLQVELAMLMIGCFFTGAALILLFDVVGGAKRFARDRRTKKEHQQHEELEGLYLQGLDNMMNGHYRRALERFEQVLERDRGYVNALIKKGDTLRYLKRYREAAEVLDRASRIAPENLVSLYVLSDVYQDAGLDERRRSTLERIIEIDPDRTVSAHRKLRDMLVEKLEWEEAARVQDRLLEMITVSEERELEGAMARGIRLGLGADLLRSGRPKEAEETFRGVLEDDPGFVPAYIRLAEVLEAMDETEEAARTLRRGFEVTGSTEPLSALQNVYLRDEQPEEALGVWKQSLVLTENELPLRYCLGKLYYRLFMLDEALREFQLIEDRVSGLPALHLYIARILETQGNVAGALSKTKLLVAEVKGLMMDHICESCGWRSAEWAERCVRCRRWGSVSLHLPASAAPEPTIRPAPTWSTP
ncbi:MAG TPA: lipopolysaccharide assembly protein LapA domain-containing protein [Vicinamibacteria bacterium]|nr:lipopolysaccharide assembly protein LapA domain-containing protein [Vicinamibacteria bacterium]